MWKHLLPLTLVACTGVIDGVDPNANQVDDPFTDLEKAQQEGPPRYASRVHSCPKIRYLTLGHLLASRGVNLASTGELTAGKIYSSGASALGAANYAARVRENIDLGLATTAKMFDVFAQAAPEIIASMPNRAECQIAGVGARLFDESNHCVAAGVTCLIGVPATPAHLDVCNETIARAADVESGKRLAVAILAAAAHTCE